MAHLWQELILAVPKFVVVLRIYFRLFENNVNTRFNNETVNKDFLLKLHNRRTEASPPTSLRS